MSQWGCYLWVSLNTLLKKNNYAISFQDLLDKKEFAEVFLPEVLKMKVFYLILIVLFIILECLEWPYVSWSPNSEAKVVSKAEVIDPNVISKFREIIKKAVSLAEEGSFEKAIKTIQRCKMSVLRLLFRKGTPQYRP